jgi:hypothetical protein
MKYMNYFVSSKNARLVNGHIEAKNLYEKILGHDGSEAYCCYFDLDYDKLKTEFDTLKEDSQRRPIYRYILNPTPEVINPNWKNNGKTFTQYEGICRPSLGMVSFDFDSEDPEDSLDDVIEFIDWLGIDDIAVFFSGSKGFHVMVPFGYFPLEPNEHLPNQLKDMVKILKEEHFPTLDDSIYNYNRKFRAPFTKHDKTNYYKSLISLENFPETIGEIISQNDSAPYDFLKKIDPEKKRDPLNIFIDLHEKAKRKSYEIEKERAGTKELPSAFERFDNKLCIKKMLESRCDDVGRNNAAIRIINDYYRTGKPQQKCEDDLTKWANVNGLPLREVFEIISNIYQRGGNYNYGCQDEIKSIYCSGKCDLWIKLDPDKRPDVVDAPASSNLKLKNEFVGVTWLMENIFGCYFDRSTHQFKDGLIVKQNAKDLFYYKDNHWQYLDEAKVHLIKTKLNAKYEK